MTAETIPREAHHVPVMLPEMLAQLGARDGGVYVDGTFGGGGYSRAILDAANCGVIGIDRDPDAVRRGQALVEAYAGRLKLIEGRFSDMKGLLARAGILRVDGVALDIGVSSTQIDMASRGFSFLRDGPLDMRMGRSGPTAADLVNTLSADQLGNIIYIYGEEPRSRAIARAIVAARAEAPILTTLALVRAIEKVTGPQRQQDRTHPATRTFQALRIQVNGELDELVAALHAAEEVLAPGGSLVVVTFHSLEDRIVKRFFISRSGQVPLLSRHAPELARPPAPSFTLAFRGHLSASEAECGRNPRSRSAKLRAGIRTSAAVMPSIADEIGVAVAVKGKR